MGLIAQKTGFRGEVRLDPSQPDGQPRRCLDTTRAATFFGFKATTPFEEGLRQTVEWYRSSRLRLAGAKAGTP